MGGGGLRILGHKKWHVWRRENVERVLRDERANEERQRARGDLQRRREQERRAEALGGSHATPRHINFFEKEEEAHTLALLQGEAGSRDSSVRQQNETLGLQARLPWYASADVREQDASSSRKRKREVEKQDPLRMMRPARVAEEEEAEADEDERVRRRRGEKRSRASGGETSQRADRKEENKKKKKEEKKKKHKRRRRDSDSEEHELMALLRQERDEREALERARTERLMRGH